MEKQFSHMFLGFIVVIFNFLKVRGGGGGGGVWGGGGLTNHRIFYLCLIHVACLIEMATKTGFTVDNFLFV